MQTKQSKTVNKKPGRSLTPEGQIRRQRKTQDIKREIRQEWNLSETSHRLRKPRDPACFWRLSQLAAAAGEDYRKNGRLYGQRQKVFEFYWKPRQAEPIKVKYFVSYPFRNAVLLPPERCIHIRAAMGI